MSKTITFIELLEMIKENKIKNQTRIIVFDNGDKYRPTKFTFNENDCNFYNEYNEPITICYEIRYLLNEAEIEFLDNEETTDIEEMRTTIISDDTISGLVKSINRTNEDIHNKINELIRAVNNHSKEIKEIEEC